MRNRLEPLGVEEVEAGCEVAGEGGADGAGAGGEAVAASGPGLWTHTVVYQLDG